MRFLIRDPNPVLVKVDGKHFSFTKCRDILCLQSGIIHADRCRLNVSSLEKEVHTISKAPVLLQPTMWRVNGAGGGEKPRFDADGIQLPPLLKSHKLFYTYSWKVQALIQEGFAKVVYSRG